MQEFKLSFAKLLLSTSQLRHITLEPGNIIPPPTTSKDYVALQQALLLENVEHCGGKPEQAGTGILCH